MKAALNQRTGDEVMIEVRGLRSQFGDQVVHDNLDLDVHRGEILGVVGGSGTGKSVLMRTILGLRRPDAGTVRVLGQDLLDVCPRKVNFFVESGKVQVKRLSITPAESVREREREYLSRLAAKGGGEVEIFRAPR